MAPLVGVSLIIPALNEAEAIGPTLRELPWDLLAECVVVDNGSTDATAAVAQANGARVVCEPRRGYGCACAAGVHAAAASSQVLAFIDGDGSDISADLRTLTAPVIHGTADFVIGSRLRGQRERGSMQPSQVFAGWLAGKLMRWRFGVTYTDMGPMRVISRAAFERLDMSEMTYGWNIEMQIRAAQRGLRIVALPTGLRCRRGGVSKVSGSLTASARAAVRIFAAVFRLARETTAASTRALP